LHLAHEPSRVLTATEVPARSLRIGVVVAGVGWQLVQILGTYFLTHAVRGTQEAYGVFGLVLGLIAWIYLLALITVIAAEINVVADRRLWPRALLAPFTVRIGCDTPPPPRCCAQGRACARALIMPSRDPRSGRAAWTSTVMSA
jgi:hypothetical protein